jgi:hypothetical protein
LREKSVASCSLPNLELLRILDAIPGFTPLLPGSGWESDTLFEQLHSAFRQMPKATV